VAVSASSTRAIRPSRTMCPSVQGASLNECPDPAARSGRPVSAARATASTSSASLAGSSIAAGAQR